ncbi:hypothetical protein I4U23_015025 [Adineta vaga]|nr:hypothetical protein I4U23_015025 [Adineta vaga]
MINARVVIIKAFMLSADRLFVYLQINFDSSYTNFRLSRIKIMKRALSKAGTVIIYKKYRGNNYYKSKRHTLVVLQTNTNNFNKLFQSIQTTNYLLIQDTDPRQSIQTSKVQPTNCIKMVSNELKYRIVVNRSQDYQFYCFDWIATKSHETFSVSFVFNIGKQQYVYIDDITFNSTSNFIQNGNFERKMGNEWSCNNRSCLSNHVKDNPKSGAFSFRTDGSLSLTQLILESIESNKLYQLGFWLKLSCDPTDPCTVVVHIGAQNLSYNSSS